MWLMCYVVSRFFARTGAVSLAAWPLASSPFSRAFAHFLSAGSSVFLLALVRARPRGSTVATESEARLFAMARLLLHAPQRGPHGAPSPDAPTAPLAARLERRGEFPCPVPRLDGRGSHPQVSRQPT